MWSLILILLLYSDGNIVRDEHPINTYASFAQCVEKSLELTHGLSRAFPDIENYVVLCTYRKDVVE